MMSKINIQYMTDEALETLRINIPTVTKYLIENPESSEWLKEFVSSDLYVTKRLQIEDYALLTPKDDKDRETDYRNSITLYENLKHLPLHVLTDEHFWMWINFEKGYRAALKHMPITEAGSVFKDHWLFTQGKRRGLFFGVLSRFYLRVALSVDASYEDDPYKLTKFVTNNPLRFREFTWRAYSGEKSIILGALKAEHRVLSEYPEFSETGAYYKEIAKLLSKLGSVMLLDCMTEKDIEEFVYTKYKSMVIATLSKQYQNNDSKDGTLGVLT